MKNPPPSTPILLGLLVGGSALAFFVFRHPIPPISDAAPAAVGQARTLSAAAPSGTHITPDLISSTSTPLAGSIEYRNGKYLFSFYHSPQGVVKEYDEGGGAMTVVEENLQKVRGFQVFIVPYAEPTISEERFKMDVPSGVRTNVQNTVLDGVKAVTFNSQDALLGDTREIWVIRGGYLYEITTFQGVGNWFDPIISTWKFL